jgi:hypothetical protein
MCASNVRQNYLVVAGKFIYYRRVNATLQMRGPLLAWNFSAPAQTGLSIITQVIKPLFMKDGNSAYGHKSTSNCYAKWRIKHGIILMPHLATSPNMNLIEKCWQRIKQSLHRRNHQPLW